MSDGPWPKEDPRTNNMKNQTVHCVEDDIERVTALDVGESGRYVTCRAFAELELELAV